MAQATWWMWVNTLALSDDYEDTAAVLQMIRESSNVFHPGRGHRGPGFSWPRGSDRRDSRGCVRRSRGGTNPGERRLLVGALSSALLANKKILADPRMQRAIRAYIDLLAEDVKLAHSAQMVIARHLAKIIGIERRYIEPEPWIRLLDQNYTPPARVANTVSQLRFFGIEAEGDRICYLIDMSNSMLRPIDSDLLRKGPVTGPSRRKRGQIPDETDIPWHRINSRFDLAREHLKISIQRLPKGKRFCVVWFGNEVGMLESTPGMIPATRANINRARQRARRHQGRTASGESGCGGCSAWIPSRRGPTCTPAWSGRSRCRPGAWPTGSVTWISRPWQRGVTRSS